MASEQPGGPEAVPAVGGEEAGSGDVQTVRGQASDQVFYHLDILFATTFNMIKTKN